MIYVYCRRASDGAALLAKELGGQRIRQFDGVNFIRKGKKLALADGDVVICWGDQAPEDVAKGKNVKFLNNVKAEHLKMATNKYEAAQALINAGVPTVDVYHRDYFGGNVVGNKTARENLKAQGYMPRKRDHVGGNDLLADDTIPDYWVRMDTFTDEFRIHSFAGKSIRAGKKVYRDGFSLNGANGTIKANPKIRSYDGGWKISYDDFKSTSAMRTIAHKAVAALGLTFGAVDVARRPDGKFVVLEVNRAPGIEGNSIRSYAEVIKRWINGDTGIREDDAPAGAVAGLDVAKPAAPAPVPAAAGTGKPKLTAKYVPAPPAAPEAGLNINQLPNNGGQYIREYYTITVG